MSLISSYNYTKYSIFDIQKYIESLGYETEIKYDKRLSDKSLKIKNSKVSVDLPILEKSKDGTKKMFILPSIRFDDWSYKKIVDTTNPKLEIINHDKYENDKKLYKKLQIKFRQGKKTMEETIKDWDRICKITKYNRLYLSLVQNYNSFLDKIFGRNFMFRWRVREHLKFIDEDE